MGRSAKLHKRVKKSTAGSTSAPTKQAPKLESKKVSAPTVDAIASVQSAKKRASLKERAKPKAGQAKSEGHVLSGMDYVTLLTGGRKKVAEEASKLQNGV